MAKANDLRCVVGRFMPGKQVWNDEKNAALASVQSSANGIREYDVVCGKKANSNAGNEKFRLLIQRNRQTYQSTNTRDAKKKIIERIIEQVHTAGGRFLKVVGGKVLMEELSYEGCYEKVSHALRSARAPVSNVVRSKEEIHKGFGSLLELQRKLFQEYLDAEGLGLYDEVPTIKSKPDSPTVTGTDPKPLPIVSIPQTEDPITPMDESTDFPGPDPFDPSRKLYVEFDHETLGLLAMLR